MVTDLYPFTLEFSDVTATVSIQNSNGDMIDVPAVGGTNRIPCRYAINQQGALIRSEDGQNVTYGFTISMPKGEKHLPFGTEITIKDGDMIMQRGTVKLFHRGLMDSKAWV